jgi:hypothetical protein
MPIDSKYGHGHSIIMQSKVASHCDKASMEKGRLEQMKVKIEKELWECKKFGNRGHLSHIHSI